MLILTDLPLEPPPDNIMCNCYNCDGEIYDGAIEGEDYFKDWSGSPWCKDCADKHFTIGLMSSYVRIYAPEAINKAINNLPVHQGLSLLESYCEEHKTAFLAWAIVGEKR